MIFRRTNVSIYSLKRGELQRLATTKKIAKQLLSFNLISYKKLCACLVRSFLIWEGELIRKVIISLLVVLFSAEFALSQNLSKLEDALKT